MSKIDKLYKEILLEKEKIDVDYPKDRYIKKYLSDFSNLETIEMSENANVTIELFKEILKVCSLHLNPDERKEYNQEIIKMYENIENIELDKDIKENYNNELMRFLKTIKNDANSETLPEIKKMEEFSSVLDQINILFDLKNRNNLYVFPIGDLLKHVINSKVKNFSKLDNNTIAMIALALQVFDYSPEFDDEKKELTSLLEKCNIELFNYLKFSRSTENIQKNLIYNKTISIVDKEHSKIYIRSTNLEYFNEFPNEVKEEKNVKDEIIAKYILIDIIDDVGIDYYTAKDILSMGNIEIIIQLLELIVDKGCQNLFMEDSLYISNEKLYLTNPYCGQDLYYIVKSQQWKCNKEKMIRELISGRQNLIIERNSKYMDFITLGYLMNMIEIFNLNTVEEYIKDSNMLSNEQNYSLQDAYLYTALERSSLKESEITSLLNFLESNTSYINSEREFGNKKMSEFSGFLPVSIADNVLDRIYQTFLKKKLTSAIVQENESLPKNSENGIIRYDNRDGVYKDSNGEQYNHLDEDTEVQFSEYIEFEDKKYVSQEISDLHKIITKIEESVNSMLEQSLYKNFENLGVAKLFGTMELQSKLLCNYDLKSVDSIKMYRLINHLLKYKIFEKKQVEDLIDIYCNGHNIVNFEKIINNNEKLQLDNHYDLNLFKDAISSDSTSLQIVNKYLKNNLVRNNLEGLSSRVYLEIIDDKYVCKSTKKIIKNVNLIFDTTITGTSTLATLRYFFEGTDENAFKKVTKIYEKNNMLNVSNICNQNKCSAKIYIFACTVEAEREINEYLSKFHFEIKPELIVFSYIDIIFNKSLKTKMKNVYGSKVYEQIAINMAKDQYFVIREFNQPKRNLLPNDELRPDNIFNLFAIKKEMN